MIQSDNSVPTSPVTTIGPPALTERYDRRQTNDGYVVFDLWTGETVVIACVAQDDLSSLDAEELVRKLNERAAAGMRDLLQ